MTLVKSTGSLRFTPWFICSCERSTDIAKTRLELGKILSAHTLLISLSIMKQRIGCSLEPWTQKYYSAWHCIHLTLKDPLHKLQKIHKTKKYIRNSQNNKIHKKLKYNCSIFLFRNILNVSKRAGGGAESISKQFESSKTSYFISYN